MVSELNRFHKRGAMILGGIIMTCGASIGIIAFRLVLEMHIGSESIGNIIITAFWCGVPLFITGFVGVMAGHKGSRDLLTGFIVPCLICFLLSLLQAVSFGRQYKKISPYVEKILDMDCSKSDIEEQCDLMQATIESYIGFIFVSVMACVFSLVAFTFSLFVKRGIMSSQQTPEGTQATRGHMQQPYVTSDGYTQHFNPQPQHSQNNTQLNEGYQVGTQPPTTQDNVNLFPVNKPV